MFRSQQVNSQLHRGIIQFAVGIIISLLCLGLLESIFYFTVPVRLKTAEFCTFFFFIAVLFISLRYLLNKNTIFNNSSDHSLAIKFEHREPKIGDRLLNALQLEESIEVLDKGKDLAEYAVSRVSADLKKIPLKSLYDPIPYKLKKTLSITSIIAVVLLLVFIKTLPGAFVRLAHPKTEFPIPLPFILNSLSGNQEILGGDTLTVSVAGYGELPDSIHFHWKNLEESGIITVPQQNEVYNHTFMG
ncbi:uncharacterized protein METZ01_LOCUS241298, partial [marine metagenome]